MKSLLIAISLLLCYSYCYAQEIDTTTTKVFGQVTDAKSGEPLPFVDVYFIGKDHGITSDIDGYYSIEWAGKADSIGFAYLGYNKKHLHITPHKIQKLNIELQESSLDLEITTITASRKKAPKDTAAIALWRKVVRHRAKNSIANADGYSYQDYIQTGFDWYNPSLKAVGLQILKKPLAVVDDYIQKDPKNDIPYLPFLLKETIQDVKYRKSPKDKKVTILADKMSGMDNESLSDFLGDELNEIDPYKDMILLTGKSFVSPFAATANINYNYFITDSVERNGDQYYLLTFVGKRKQDFTFLGAAWIHKPTFAIESIELEISPHIALNFIKELHVIQYYQPTPEGVWIKTNEELESLLAIDLFDFGSRKKKKVKKNQARIRKKMSRHDILINPAFEVDAFEQEDMKFEENSTTLAKEQWDSLRPIPLDSLGEGVYEMIDSIQRTFFYKTMDWAIYAMITNHLRAGPVEFGPWPEFGSWNEIEGFRLKMGLRTTKKLFKNLQLHGTVAYGFRDKQWKYSTGFIWKLPTKNRRWNAISVSYMDDFRMMGQRNIAMRHDNFMAAISRSTPIDRLMKLQEFVFKHEKDWFMGFYSKIGYRWRRFNSVLGGFEFTRDNGDLPVSGFNTSEFLVSLHWGHQERFWTDNSGFRRESMGTEFPILDLDYVVGVKDFLDGEHSYHRLEFKLRHRLNSLIGYTRYQLHLSKAWGQLPYPSMTVHLGNESYMGNNFAYALMNEFEFVSDAYAAIWVSHHFDGWILNSIPLLNKLKLRSIFIFKGLYGTVEAQNRNLYDLPQGVSAPNFYAEIGFGIENILKVLRVDFIWRLTHLGQPEVRPFGVNISIAPKF